MILQAITTSERGKSVSKCGNDYVMVDITLNRNLFAKLFINSNGDIELRNSQGKFVVKMNPVIFCEFGKEKKM